jgi:phosphate transport system permease protein
MIASHRMIVERIAIAVCGAAAVFSALMLFVIIGQIFLGALPSLTPYFLFTPENKTPGLGQGIANAVVGTILISVLSTILAAPFAFGTAVYLKRYAPDNRITRQMRFMIEVLSGTPSIVIGMFGLLVLVFYLKPITGGFSLIAGSVALAILTMPVIERAFESAIDTVAKELEEGSYALGATRWQTISMITIPTAMNGITTGLVLGFGRAAEESSVVILTAGYSQFMPEFRIAANPNFLSGFKLYPLNDLVGTLPFSVYNVYENSNVIKMSSGYAAAFILIVVVLLVNIAGKTILLRNSTKKSKGSACMSGFKKLFSPPARIPANDGNAVPVPGINDSNTPADSALPVRESEPQTGEGTLLCENVSGIKTIPRLQAWISSHSNFAVPGTRQENKDVPRPVQKSDGPGEQPGKIRIFLRAFLPFAIPAALLLIIAALASFPPLHHALGPASAPLAGLFAAGLSLVVAVAGLVFGLILAKRGGAFRAKTRRIGYVSVAAGICLLCISGIVCASTASGIFNTGDQPIVQSTKDRQAQLDALAVQYDESGGSTVSMSEPVTDLSSSAPARTSGSPATGNLTTVTVPVKNALSLGESYRYGDATRICDASVYDYTVLPFYFWWFIDYNRFVRQAPRPGYSYLVVFIRMEDIGTRSTIVPSADMIHVTNNGNSYDHLPYFNKSVLSDFQTGYYSTHYDKLPYQWIRELGQDKRDYAYLTGYNIFGDWEFATSDALDSSNNATSTDSTSTDSTDSDSTGFVTTDSTSTNSTDTNGTGFFVKPGPGNAVDGFLIFEVPDNVRNDLDNTYVGISFNANSGTQWRLNSTAG